MIPEYVSYTRSVLTMTATITATHCVAKAIKSSWINVQEDIHAKVGLDAVYVGLRGVCVKGVVDVEVCQ